MAAQPVDLIEIGRTGLERFGGNVYEEFLPDLTGTRAVKVYREMSENDPVVGAFLFAIDMLMRNVSWTVRPYSQRQEDLEAADFLKSCMEDMSMTWEDTISEILSMLVYGWSYHEIVYKIRAGDSLDPSRRSRFADGRIGWRKLPIRAQESLYEWIFDEAGGIRGMVQQAPPDYELRTIPIEKALLFRTRAHKGNPEGRSILRNAYRAWYFKRHIEEIEGIGIERDLAGLPVAWVPPKLLSPNATPAERMLLEEIKRIIVNVRRDEQEGVIFPLMFDDNNNKVYDFTLLSTGGQRQFNTDSIVARYDQRIAMTVMADFILLGHENVGSFALSSSKTNLFAVALGAWLQSIAGVFNRHAVPRLFELNGYRLEALPQLEPGDIEVPDLQELGAYIQSLAGAGMPLFPDQALETYLRQVAGLPAPAFE